MSIYYKSADEIELMRKSARLVSQTLAEVASSLKPGMTLLEIDRLAERFIRSHGAIPSFKNYHGFPNAACISVNEAVVHGIPSDYPLKDGDIVSVDLGVILNDFHGDSAYTFAIGDVNRNVLSLLRDTKDALYKGIEQAVVGNRIGDISFAIQQHTEKERGYGIVRELVGHGLGRSLHEDPQVPNYGKRGKGRKLKEGLVICIEPMINLGGKEVAHKEDGWTVVTRDGSVSAHYEHVVLVKKGTAEVLSDFGGIEEAEKANAALNSHY